MKQQNIYTYKKSSPDFTKRFNREKTKLKKVLPSYINIEHIGSTAVEGLGGKGIIDIMIGTSANNIQTVKKILEKEKYILGTSSSKERFFFKREYQYRGEYRRIHLHLTPIESKTWKDAIKFRDLLRQNKKLREGYTKTKKEAFKKCKGNGEICRKIKNNFIEWVLK